MLCMRENGASGVDIWSASAQKVSQIGLNHRKTWKTHLFGLSFSSSERPDETQDRAGRAELPPQDWDSKAEEIFAGLSEARERRGPLDLRALVFASPLPVVEKAEDFEHNVDIVREPARGYEGFYSHGGQEAQPVERLPTPSRGIEDAVHV